MNQFRTVIFLSAALAVVSCAWGQLASSGMAGTYADFEAASLRKRPQDAWARSIAFRDEITATDAAKPQRLDRRMYIPIELKTAGTAWVREDLSAPFLALPSDTEFTFGGTVDQFNRRYYLILDAAYQVETLPTQEERWTDVLANPPVPPAPDFLADDTGDLPEPPAADIPDEPPSWSDVMTGIVDITEPSPEPEPASEPVAESEPDPEPVVEAEPAPEPEAMAFEIPETAESIDSFDDFDFPEDSAVENSEAAIEPPPALPIEVASVPPAVEDFTEFDALFDEFDSEPMPDQPAPVEDTLSAETEPLVVEEELLVAEEEPIP